MKQEGLLKTGLIASIFSKQIVKKSSKGSFKKIY